MSSNLVDSLFEEPNEHLLEILLSEFTSLKKFGDHVKVLSYYHVKRCEQENCSQFLFAINLHYVYTEHVIQEKKMSRNYVTILLYVKNNLLHLNFWFIDLLVVDQPEIIVPNTETVSIDSRPKQTKKYITTRMNSAIRAANKIKNKYKKLKRTIGKRNGDCSNKSSTDWLKAAGYLDTKDQDAICYIYVLPKKNRWK